MIRAEVLLNAAELDWWIERIDKPVNRGDLNPGLHDAAKTLVAHLREYGGHWTTCRPWWEGCRCGWGEVESVLRAGE